jgi:hypothetical protein
MVWTGQRVCVHFPIMLPGHTLRTLSQLVSANPSNTGTGCDSALGAQGAMRFSRAELSSECLQQSRNELCRTVRVCPFAGGQPSLLPPLSRLEQIEVVDDDLGR